jgi:hypothetical protein
LPFHRIQGRRWRGRLSQARFRSTKSTPRTRRSRVTSSAIGRHPIDWGRSKRSTARCCQTAAWTSCSASPGRLIALMARPATRLVVGAMTHAMGVEHIGGELSNGTMTAVHRGRRPGHGNRLARGTGGHGTAQTNVLRNG